MGKAAPQPQAPLPPPAPPPPPTTPVQAVGDTEDRTPTEVLAEREEAQQAVVTSPDTVTTPQRERSMPASVIDTETAGRKEERRIASRQGRRSTQVTGPQGLLTPAPVKKRGLLGS